MTTRETIESWLAISKQQCISEYDASNRRASGNWANKLDTDVISTEAGYRAILYGAHYSYWMIKGRRPGKFPPPGVIQQWIKDKGIIADGISEKSLAYLIGRKISLEGYKGKPIIETVFTDQRISDLLNQVGKSFLNQTKVEILQILKA